MFFKNLLNYKISYSIFLGFLFSLVIGILIYKQLIYPTIIPMVIKGGASLFADWTVILNANLCLEKGFDVFMENPCDKWNRKHVYGELLLNIPFIRTYPKFFFLYLPIIFGSLFLIIISNILFVSSKKKYWPSLLIFIFSVPTLLVLERGNIDLLIFIFLFLVSKNYNLFINYVLIIISSIVKFYPIFISIIFIFNKKTFRHIFILALIVFFILFFQKDTLMKIFNNQAQFSGYGYGLYEFSFLGFLKFFKLLSLNFGSKDFSWLKYIYFFLFIIIPIISLNYFLNTKIKNFVSNFDINVLSSFEERLFFGSVTIILFCYFSFSNFIYREIFFLGLIPFIINTRTNLNDFSLFFYNFLLAKFFLTTLFIYLSQNNIVIILNPLLILLKHTLDLCLISLVLNIYIISLFKFIKNKFGQVPQ